VFSQSCTSTAQCGSLQTCIDSICVTKDLFPPSLLEIIGTISVALINSLGSASGIGGGALLVPYFILIFQRSVTQSIDYSFAVVFGGALGNYLNTAFIRDPINHGPAINYDVNLLVLPMLMIGVTFGLFLHIQLPDLATYLLLLSVLVYTLYKNTLQYKHHSTREETRGHEGRGPEHLSEQSAESSLDFEDENIEGSYPEEKEEKQELLRHHDDDSEAKFFRSESGSAKGSERSPPSNRPQPELKPLFPWSRFKEILLLLFAVIFFNVMRGGQSPSIVGVTMCSTSYWIITGIMILSFVLLYIRNIYLTRSWQRDLIREKHLFRKNEIIFTKKKSYVIGGTSLVAGLYGATVGIGGAMIIGPRLLDYHMPPKYSTFTTGFFVIFTMFGSLMGVLLQGHISILEILWFAGFAFLCSFFMSRWVTEYMKKTGKQSLVLIFLLIATAISMTIIITICIIQMIRNRNDMLKFHELCV